MAEGIVYLDVDDEITSAASRIRTAPGTKVGLVVPYGSRIATSRMNFRLLSREAVVSNHRLSIVSGDAAARSLAASAGLPVFGTVGEYEAAMATGASNAGAEAPGTTGAAAGPATVFDSETIAAVAPAGQSRDGDTSATATVVAPTSAPARKSQRPQRPAPAVPPPVGAGPTDGVVPDQETGAGRLPPLVGLRVRTPVIVALGLVVLALIVTGVAAYLFLPSATIAVTPRRDVIAPIQLTILADPDATTVDPVGLVIPAVRLDVPVEATRTFPTTGTKVVETAARGSVTFTNYDPTASNTVPAGSIVSTEGGIRFRTLSTLIVPRASFTPPSTTVPSEASVDIQAIQPGTAGNVPANAIRVVPAGESSLFLAVRNPEPTTGGTHTETPRVSKPEVDQAVTQLRTDLDAAFRENIAAGAGAPAGTTLFPATAVLGTATPDPDPQTLVGQAVESYDLRLTATGTVIAVDPTPVRAIAEAQLASHVAAGHRLVEGSTKVDVGDGLVGEDGQVSFLATVSATEVMIVDPEALRELVKGKTADDARAALARFGDVTVTLWPDWVSTVTSVDARLTVTVTGAPGEGGTSPSPGASSRPSARPSANPLRSPSARPGASVPGSAVP
jgi:hypothetical protein